MIHASGSKTPASISDDSRKASIAQYREMAADKFGNPDYFNADLAKELFPQYSASNAARRDHSSALQPLAAALRDSAFNARLAQPASPGEIVTFMAGGTGSGKSSSAPPSGIVYDTTLGKQDRQQAFELVNRVLASGRDVRLEYVFTDPVIALLRALQRAKRIGRMPSLQTHANTHEVAHQTVSAIAGQFKDDSRVSVISRNNSGERPSKNEAIPSFDYSGILDQLQSALDAERSAARIDDATYRVCRGMDARRLGQDGAGPSGAG